MKRTKYNLKKLFDKAYAMVIEAGVHPAPKEKITLKQFSAETQWGNCSKESKNSDVFTIKIAEKTILLGADAILKTFVHEILHTINGCFNHGQRWAKAAERVNKKYGLNISRVTNAWELGGEEAANMIEKMDIKAAKYQVKCTNCGRYLLRYRKCHLVDNITRYRCGICGGKLEVN